MWYAQDLARWYTQLLPALYFTGVSCWKEAQKTFGANHSKTQLHFLFASTSAQILWGKFEGSRL